MKKIAVIMGSINDWDHIKDLEQVFSEFNYPFEKLVVSAHRTPEYMYDFAKEAESKYHVIIAAAGGSAHLPGMVASLTTLPVIGIPIKSKTFEGIDSLLSIIQMPFGTPVATVGVDSGKNAALLALKIVGLSDSDIKNKLQKFKKDTANTVLNNSFTKV